MSPLLAEVKSKLISIRGEPQIERLLLRKEGLEKVQVRG